MKVELVLVGFGRGEELVSVPLGVELLHELIWREMEGHLMPTQLVQPEDKETTVIYKNQTNFSFKKVEIN